MKTKDFYKNIVPFSDFHDALNIKNYHNVPKDWLVVIADIKGSTKAIEAGRYKDVNIVGASSIMAVLNAINGLAEIPYVFGGDGASFIIPPGLAQPVCAALEGTKEMAREEFGLILRAGIVPVSDLTPANKIIKVAKYGLSQHADIAMFSGGGLAYADGLIKQHEDRYDTQNYIENNKHIPTDFNGLECRWNPVKTKKGAMLTLIVHATNDDTSNDVYAGLIKKMESIYGHQNDYRPNHDNDMSLSLNPKTLIHELRVRTSGKTFKERISYIWKMAFENIVGNVMLLFNLKSDSFDGEHYVDEMVMNTDFQKFDDVLRMVIDSDSEQTRQLKSYLENAHAQGELCYGLHEANEALITCLVFNRIGEHLHFIDGASGGYALAAKNMKEQMKHNS